MLSDLTEYTKLSPNTSGERTHRVERITPHCVVGQLSIESLGEWFSRPSTNASSNYGIDKDGRVGLFVPEDERAWTSSSNENDQKSITIECASDLTPPYAFRPAVFEKLIELCADICRRYGKARLVWISDRDEALAYEPGPDELVLTVHRWFAPTDCPGDWLMSHMSELAGKVNGILAGGGGTAGTEADEAPNEEPTKEAKEAGGVISGPDSFIASIVPACQESMQAYGILASVSIAQACLESAYGQSELAKKANNLYGMKASVSGNSWPGSVWEGLPYLKMTAEYDPDGTRHEVRALFRSYESAGLSVQDHAAYLAGAKKGQALRYAGIVGEKDPRTVCEILQKGGYATDPGYAQKLVSMIGRYNLTKYDENITTGPLDASGGDSKKKAILPYLVRIHIDDLNIRSGPGTAYRSEGYIKPGVYTIVDTYEADGRGWGKLKSGAGWVCLDYVELVGL